MSNKDTQKNTVPRAWQDGLDVDPSSYVDPNGFVFHENGKIFRAIYPRVAPFYRGLIDSGFVKQLVETRGLVSTRIIESGLPQLPGCLILNHDKIVPATYCVEWCHPMLADAAMLTIDLALELAKHDCMLQDAYPWNVLFQHTKPVFVDFTSIIEADQHLLWPAMEQFEAFFVRPLALSSLGKGKEARCLLFDNINGIMRGDILRNVTLGYYVSHPGLILSCLVDRWIQRSPALKRNLRASIESRRIKVGKNIRCSFLARQRRRIQKLKGCPLRDPWADYYKTIPDNVNREQKVRTVGKLLAKTAPSTVTDLGCNTGIFSILAARQGASVNSVDSSEACVASIYELAKKEGLKITCIVADVLCPTPSYGFMGTQYPSLPERIRADLVMCLGLMHHLHITGRQSFDRIAQLLRTIAGKHVIFEFISKEDENNELLSTNRAIDYTLDSVKMALASHFDSIVVHESDRSTRKLLLCSI